MPILSTTDAGMSAYDFTVQLGEFWDEPLSTAMWEALEAAVKQRDIMIRADERQRVREIVSARIQYVTTGLVYRGRDYVPAPDVVRALDRCQQEIARALATERDEGSE